MVEGTTRESRTLFCKDQLRCLKDEGHYDPDCDMDRSVDKFFMVS